MRLLRLLLPATFVALSLCASGRAAPPTITLTLNQATLPEACAALSEATGLSVKMGAVPNFSRKPEPPIPQRESFAWKQATLSRVLRDLCDRFDLTAGQGPGPEVSVYPRWPFEPGVVPPPVLEVGVAEKNGVRFSIGGIDLQSNRSLALEGPPAEPPSGSMGVTIVCRSEKLDREKVAYLENVVARDDQGTVLVGEVMGRRGPMFGGFPDEFAFNVRFPAPHPRATRLVWLEAELGAYDQVHPIDIRLALGREPQDLEARPKPLSLEVVSFEQGEPLEGASTAQDGGPELRARMAFPLGAVVTTQGMEDDRGAWPHLVDSSGKSHYAFSSSGTGGHKDDLNLWNAIWRFPRLPLPAKEVRFSLAQKLFPHKHADVRLRDIPLPRLDGAAASTPFSGQELEAQELDPKTLRHLPKLGFKLTQVDATQAAAALTKAGLRVEVEEGPPTRKESFDWTQRNAREAVRELALRHGFGIDTDGTGALLLTSTQPPPVPVAKPGPISFTRHGVRVSVQRLSQSDSRQRRFVRPTDARLMQILYLTLGIDSGDLEPNQLAGIGNLRFKVDEGKQAGSLYFRDLGGDTGLSNQPGVSVDFPFPYPEARKLTQVQGDLFTYSEVSELRIDFPAGVGSTPVQRQVGDVTAELKGNLPRAGGKDLYASVKVSAPSGVKLDRVNGALLVVVGQSGRRYSTTSSVGDRGTSSTPELGVQAEFRDIPEPIEKVEVLVVRRAGLRHLLHFNLNDIPLPAEPAFQPKPVPRPKEKADRGPALSDAKGGSIEFSVQLDGAAAPEGVLRVALTPIGTGAIRWFEVPVDERGRARLDSIKPGSYRVLLSYHPDASAPVPAKGHWIGTESKATVQRGRSVRVPVLRWVAS